MNRIAVLVFLSAFSATLRGQLATLPPSSSTDGIPVLGLGINAGSSHWESASTLGAYRFASDDTLATPNMGSPDNALGLSWAPIPPPSFTSAMQDLNRRGGTLRMIFLGESASWLNDFGYTYSGDPSGPNSFTAFRNISAVSPGNTISFGDHLDLPLLHGDAETLDFWFNAVGAQGPTTPAATNFGGVYTVLHPANSTPALPISASAWAQRSLLVNTWIPALRNYVDVPTFLVGLEDWRTDRGSDMDNNDFLFAFQVFAVSGGSEGLEIPSLSSPVPEPSTYGILGACGLMGLAIWRQRKTRGVTAPRASS